MLFLGLHDGGLLCHCLAHFITLVPLRELRRWGDAWIIWGFLDYGGVSYVYIYEVAWLGGWDFSMFPWYYPKPDILTAR